MENAALNTAELARVKPSKVSTTSGLIDVKTKHPTSADDVAPSGQGTDTLTRTDFMAALQAASKRDPELEWLAKNEEAAGMVHEGLEESSRKKGKFLGSFKEFESAAWRGGILFS